MYLATNLTNDKVYVGKTASVVRRWGEHLSEARRGEDTYFYRALRKYGASGFSLQQLAAVPTEAEANNLESLWIISLRSYQKAYGYNGSMGGDGGTPTEETRAKISAALRGKKRPPGLMARIADANRGRPLSPERRAKMSAAGLGKKKSPEHAMKIGLAQRGKTLSDETKAKISETLRGRKASPETCAKMSRALRGIKRSPETLEKMREAGLARWAREKALRDNSSLST